MISDIQEQPGHRSGTKSSIAFEHTSYEYHIILGTVESHASIAWDWKITVSDWETAKEVIDLWHEASYFPAVRIDLKFRGKEL